MPPTVAIVAGEASGDLLGAALIDALRERRPDLQFFGIAGPRMRAAGCEAFAATEELSVMGLVEILRHLPRLLKLRRRARETILARKPDVFVGIDSPEFNLSVSGWLKQRGISTVQYVSPQVWAWRQGRVKHIGKAVDRVLCVLPFEVDFYSQHAVDARFVGHPLADQIPLQVDRAAARQALGLPQDRQVVALLPGSRMAEVELLGADFIATAVTLARRRNPAPVFVAPMANARVRAEFERQYREAGLEAPPLTLVDGQTHRVLAAADAVLVASGTATLETTLSRRPMVVAYRLGRITAFIARELGLVKVQHFSVPNLLAGEALVPEFFQEQVKPEALADALEGWLDDPVAVQSLQQRFEQLHLTLRREGARAAADAVLELIGPPAPAA
ncbi:MAG: lipid-A-disaccharide synthase [Steroidobacteraceae bacterium]